MDCIHKYKALVSAQILHLITVFVLLQCMSCTFTITAVAVDTNDTSTTIEEPKDLYARSAVLMDADSGRILFEKEGQTELAMASTTKIMTCILTLEYGNLDDIVTVSKNAAKQPAVYLGVKEGQQFVLRDLLYSLMLESHNDTAVVIAEAIGTSVEEFSAMMNEKAKELGCDNTYFITPNGLDAEDENGIHHTTAEDLARIMKYCIMDSEQKDIFLAITQTPEYTFTDVSGANTYYCANHNSFLNMMEGALSGKTGYTNEAGYCYVGALENDGRTFIVALLACGWPNNKGYKWADTRTLMKYGIENFHYRNIYEEILLDNLDVVNGVPDNNRLNGRSTVSLEIEMPESIKETKEINLLLRDDQNVNTVINVDDTIFAPAEAGIKVGTVTYLLDNQELYSWKITTSDAKIERKFVWCCKQIILRFLF